MLKTYDPHLQYRICRVRNEACEQLFAREACQLGVLEVDKLQREDFAPAGHHICPYRLVHWLGGQDKVGVWFVVPNDLGHGCLDRGV